MCDPKAPYADYPHLSGVKAAEARSLVKAVEVLAAEHLGPEPQQRHRHLALKNLVAFYNIIEQGGFYLGAQVRPTQEAANNFLLHYSWLAKDAMKRGLLLWSVVPKHHFMAHMCLQGEFENPKQFGVYSGESFVGQMSKVGRLCLPGKAMHEVARFFFERCRIGARVCLTRL